MDNKKAVEWLKAISATQRDSLNKNSLADRKEALHMAIQALEKEELKKQHKYTGTKGDLISRSVAIEQFYKRIGGDLDANEVYYIEKVINSLPTAYDLDKVVERLEELREMVPVNRLLDDIIKDKPKELGQLMAYRKAIEIVKSGGIE